MVESGEFFFTQNFFCFALAGVTQLVGRPPVKQKVASSIPGQGICLGYGPGPLLGHVHEAT